MWDSGAKAFAASNPEDVHVILIGRVCFCYVKMLACVSMSNHTCACAPNNEHFWFQNHSWYTCLWVYKCTSFPSNCMPRSTIITSFHSGVSLIAICSSCVLSLSSLQGQIRPCSSTSILSHYFILCLCGHQRHVMLFWLECLPQADHAFLSFGVWKSVHGHAIHWLCCD